MGGALAQYFGSDYVSIRTVLPGSSMKAATTHSAQAGLAPTWRSPLSQVRWNTFSPRPALRSRSCTYIYRNQRPSFLLAARHFLGSHHRIRGPLYSSSERIPRGCCLSVRHHERLAAERRCGNTLFPESRFGLFARATPCKWLFFGDSLAVIELPAETASAATASD